MRREFRQFKNIGDLGIKTYIFNVVKVLRAILPMV